MSTAFHDRGKKCIYHLFDHYKSGSHFSVDKENFQELQIHHQQRKRKHASCNSKRFRRTKVAAISKEYDNKSTTFQKSYKYLFILRGSSFYENDLCLPCIPIIKSIDNMNVRYI